jgi:hypothetical protein
MDPHDELVPSSSTSSAMTLPEGRLVQLFNADQVPRYAKDITMQVDNTIIPSYPYISLQTPRGGALRCETSNNYVPLVRCNMNDIVQS